MKHVKSITAGLCLLTLVSCGSYQGNGAAIGAGAGAALGGIIGNIIGKDSKATAIGAAIGAAVGSGTGALIGHHMDKVAQEVSAEVQNAKVEEVTDANGLKMVKVSFDSGLLFPLNSATLNAASKNDLSQFANVLKKNSDCLVNVYGHTDKTGTDAINIPLSQKRAQSVVDFLKQHGASSSQFKVVEGKGSSDPVPGHENTVKDEANRRVEVYIYASEKMINEAKKKAGE
ncbi:MAG: OmpA family protein [Prevotella sp.]|jgi:outer membrane protein OmpA-like peptidoglycan-associated protein|nr:OmpA family protein [Prevotella sp.]